MSSSTPSDVVSVLEVVKTWPVDARISLAQDSGDRRRSLTGRPAGAGHSRQTRGGVDWLDRRKFPTAYRSGGSPLA